MNELTQGPKDTNQSCVFDFPDRPVRPIPPVGPPSDYPHEPHLDWPPDPPINPTPGVDPIPGINPHPYLNPPDTIPPGGDLFVDFIIYTQIDSHGIEIPFLRQAISPGLFPARFDISWNTHNCIGLVQEVNEFTPKTVMDPILQAENGHSTSENNTSCGLVVYSKIFADGTLVTYLMYWAAWFDLAGLGLFSLAPCLSGGGIDSPPHLSFDNAALFNISPGNFDLWKAHSSFGSPADFHTPVTKQIYTGKIVTDETIPFTTDLG